MPSAAERARYALARPDRIERLVLIGPPALPNTRCPLPYRLIATPGIGQLLPRLAPPSPAPVLQFASFMGERDTLSRYPLLIWGEREPLGAVSIARDVVASIPEARLEVLPGGHVPWLGHPGATAAAVLDFIRRRN